ncbi:hypothetical protein GUITHDRAFT_163152 [Guillardia theta CCMP2712]|uniref:CobW C-terminal domain-containing protein n=1 Tax=Guillardia theta (strain CCMP2712) TaxID=905079 RepID=L1JC45_GUITC|nr:hypothetical protein GUITHDRAFT_163152 [Guillardia theta CCMP2712]EKX45862.1 hypothetical protein GUITHDRAFT_163152 [Guillardia theta CCMP2712]|eukprot:XP_005832842.1 hypothetical protein GUITHDRAFT_163152 [Guillardia theta CCMP2712]
MVDESWAHYVGVSALMLVTFFLSNCLAWWLDIKRKQRISAKAQELSKASKLKTPVTIVTGFLGSGKTTLVNSVLSSETHGKRIVVIENEAGSISIDDKVLRAGEQEKAAVGIFVMKNGCMCCTGDGAGPELERVLNHLLNILQDDEYDYVLIETSGLADPAPIMQTFFSLSNASGRFFLDGVVAIIDCHNVWQHLDGRGWGAKTPEVYRQIAHATSILMNKTDRRNDQEENLKELEELLGELNPHAKVLRCQHCEVSLDHILDQRAFDAARVADMMVIERRLAGDEHPSAVMARHTPGIRAISWASALVEERWRDVYRMKGVLAVEGSRRLFVLQGVCGELKGQEGREWREEEEKVSELIVIGKNLNHDSIDRGFRQCLLSWRKQSEAEQSLIPP